MFRLQADTGRRPAYTDPINPGVQRDFAAASLLVRVGLYHVFSKKPGDYFNPRFPGMKPVRPGDLQKTPTVPIVFKAVGRCALYYNRRLDTLGTGRRCLQVLPSTTIWLEPRGARMRFGLTSGSAAGTTTISARKRFR